MAKALKEAKLNTSWIQPNEEWDSAMHDFVARILDSSSRNKFLPIFLPAAKEIIRLGAINSLTQTLLKLTSPGVPDIYQGTEIWDYSLVDPDNRRPVDYELRRKLLGEAEQVSAEDAWQRPQQGLPKIWLIRRAMQVRQQFPEAFGVSGDYQPVAIEGPKS